MMPVTLRRFRFLAVFLILTGLASNHAGAATVFLSDDTPLDGGSLTRPDNRIPVLFIHGHDPDPSTDPELRNYKKNFHHVLTGLTSFKQTLDLPDNACLGIEPYYIHFGDTDTEQQRSIDIDADEIEAAVNLILARHRLAEPDNPDLKVAIIAYSKGTISARQYLKRLHPPGSPLPVSEFIAIAPPNHGLRLMGLEFNANANKLSARQLNNGYDRDCNSFNDPSQDYIANLNAPPTGAPPGSTEGEAPGSRPDGTPPGQGVLYVTLYAAGNGDFVGGSTPQDDCDLNGVDMGRKLARNLAANAVNIDTIQIPDQPPSEAIDDWLEPFLIFFPELEAQFARHQNTVHHKEVIYRALYTVVHHQTPAQSVSIPGDVPVIPPLQAGPPQAAVVLLMDTSGSMSLSHEGSPGVEESRRRLALAQKAAVPFLDMLQFFNPCRAAFGIARFPRQPFTGCFGEAITPLTPARPDTVQAGAAAIDGLSPAGSTPLLSGLGTAAGMFGGEPNKALVLLSDGFQNCPSGSSIAEIGAMTAGLQAAAIKVYTIGFGQPAEVPHDILGTLAAETGGLYYDVTTASGFDPEGWDPGTALQATYKSILADALQLYSPADPAGVIAAGERRTHAVTITERDRKAAVYLSWAFPAKDRPVLVVRTSDGRAIDLSRPQPGLQVSEGDNHILVKLDRAFLTVPGRVAAEPWTLEIGLDQAAGGQPVAYQYSVLVDSGLVLKTAIEPRTVSAGEAVRLTARLDSGGRPLPAPANVWVRVARPLAAIGNWLGDARVSPEELGRIPETRAGETLSPLLRKIIFLTEERRQFYPGRISSDLVRLYDDGTHGDATPGDGTYTGIYTGAGFAGTYAFEFNAAGRTAAGIPFERNQRLEKVFGVHTQRIDAEALRPATDPGRPGRYEITLKPADRLGNLLGPGHPHQILWEASAGRFAGSTVDLLDGRYSRTLELPPGTDPGAVGLTLVVGSSQFRVNLQEALGGAERASVGWLILLLVLVLAAMIWMLRS